MPITAAGQIRESVALIYSPNILHSELSDMSPGETPFHSLGPFFSSVTDAEVSQNAGRIDRMVELDQESDKCSSRTGFDQ